MKALNYLVFLELNDNAIKGSFQALLGEELAGVTVQHRAQFDAFLNQIDHLLAESLLQNTRLGEQATTRLPSFADSICRSSEDNGRITAVHGRTRVIWYLLASERKPFGDNRPHSQSF